MFNLFRRKEKNIIQFHSIIIKKKANKKLYVGQFLKIESEFDDNDDIIDDVKYYFSAFDQGIISNKISNKEEIYCEKYNYGIIRNINEDSIEVLIICTPGYLQRYEIELYKNNYVDGDAFIINNGNLLENKKVVGKIIDDRYNSNLNIQLNSLDKNKLVVFIQK